MPFSSEYLSGKKNLDVEVVGGGRFAQSKREDLGGKKVHHILHKVWECFLKPCFIYTTDQGRLESNFKSNNLHIDVQGS